MEKNSGIYRHTYTQTQGPPRRKWVGRVAQSAVFLLLLLVISPWSIPGFSQLNDINNNNNNNNKDEPFQWSSIPPNPVLTYTPCFGIFQCARLSVPLNWNATEHDEEFSSTAALALIKVPARVPITDPRYGGPVLVNPGGPGESGVYQVLTDGEALQTILDSGNLESTFPTEDDGKFYDVVSFDPRGVNNTTPKLDCFSSAFQQQAWQLSMPDYGLLWDSERVIGLEWARAAALGASCSHNAGGGILPYANTAQTVEDMVHIIEQLGEWRAAEAARLLTTTTTNNIIPHHLQYQPGAEKLQYWGFSYGTVIGATFAAMHPDRVSRIVLDGVVDPADHYAGGWYTQLQDADSIISKFCEYCHLAGPDACPLYTGSSASEVEARFTSILQSLKDNPIPVSHTDSPQILTYGDAHLHLLSGMYFPFATVDQFFHLLPALEARNTSAPVLAAMAARKQAALVPTPDTAPYISAMGAVQSISCMDSLDVSTTPEFTREAFTAYLAVLTSQSRWISPSWARNKIACQGYTTRAAWKPPLRFDVQQWANTSHPLLIVGNSHDTVTPLRNARRVASIFPGSVVLQQDSEGHCSHSTPSLCTARAIRRYMQTGQLPREGLVCQPDVRPFVGCIAETKCRFSSEEGKMWEALVTLADPFKLQEAEGLYTYRF
ncbi:hypothetical protein FE257_006153 [Aspergillus nanangensis]|uniref:Peptidase S33 tripeptidyl aminopeptidase-like C-terminal domain-containing protein n=1 Tax=Aspergillus nanangensis TaxID=2582783 RepID=A0AAD4CPF9_ASPNN|nr:hypothetical protein FE257_006153 [Aspergillus nanangensis]